jgi:hypothetical protein
MGVSFQRRIPRRAIVSQCTLEKKEEVGEKKEKIS